MYGFLNMCAAAALVHAGSTRDDVLAVLGESSPDAFQFDQDGMEWRGRRISTNDLASDAADALPLVRILLAAGADR